MQTITDIEPEVADAINSLIMDRLELAQMPAQECRITIGEDWTGDEAVFVDVYFSSPSDEPFDPMIGSELSHDVRDAVRKLGDKRVTYVNLRLTEGQAVVGWPRD